MSDMNNTEDTGADKAKKTPRDRVAELEQGLSDLTRAFEIFVAIKGGGPGDYAINEAKALLEDTTEVDYGTVESNADAQSIEQLSEEEYTISRAKDTAEMAKRLRGALNDVLGKNGSGNYSVDRIVMIDPVSGKAYDVATGKEVDESDLTDLTPVNPNDVKFPTSVDTSVIDRAQIPPEAANVKERRN